MTNGSATRDIGNHVSISSVCGDNVGSKNVVKSVRLGYPVGEVMLGQTQHGRRSVLVSRLVLKLIFNLTASLFGRMPNNRRMEAMCSGIGGQCPWHFPCMGQCHRNMPVDRGSGVYGDYEVCRGVVLGTARYTVRYTEYYTYDAEGLYGAYAMGGVIRL